MRFSKHTKRKLLITNLFGLGLTLFYILYWMILVPSTLTPQYELMLKDYALQCPNSDAIQKLSRYTAEWVEASNTRSRVILVVVVIFLLTMIILFLLNLKFIRGWKCE